VHWDTAETWADVTELTTTLTRLRADHPVLRPHAWRNGEIVLDEQGRELGRRNLAWFDGDEVEMDDADWRDGRRRTLGMYVSDADEAFLIWVHGGEEPATVALPGDGWAAGYTVVAHTGEPGELPTGRLPETSTLTLPPRTVAVLAVELPDLTEDAAGPEPEGAGPESPMIEPVGAEGQVGVPEED